MRYQTLALLWQRDSNQTLPHQTVPSGVDAMGIFRTRKPKAARPRKGSPNQDQDKNNADAEADDKPSQSRPASTATPTTLAEPLNIVVLGASFAGLSVAHAFFDNALNRLGKLASAPTYRLVLVSPSTHMFWNIGAPRALVKDGLIKNDDLFIPIEPGFDRHANELFMFVQGQCMALDTDARTVTVELVSTEAQRRCSMVNQRMSKAITSFPALPDESISPKVQTIPYHALIMATGSSADSDLLSLHGPHHNTISALDAFHAKAETAKSIVICGGGCSGVEVAGQLATYYNFRSHWPVKRAAKTPKQIILITGTAHLLPQLKPIAGDKAEKKLKLLGVQIRKGIRVTAAKEDFDLTGQTKIELDDDTSLIADLYIACTGVSPNSKYCPPSLKDEHNYIRTNQSSLRVDLAGPRTYAIGDVASYSQNYVQDVYAAVPVLIHNMTNDLLAHELKLASPHGGLQGQIDELVDEPYVQIGVDSQLCPVSRFGGAGSLMGSSLKSPMVHLLKRHDHNVGKAKAVR